LRLLGSTKELTQHLRIVDKIHRRFAESGSAAREARARPVENAVFERECRADGTWGVGDGERPALDVEVGGHVAAINAQELAAADVVLAGYGGIGGRAAIQRYPGAAGEICAASEGVCSCVWLDFKDECCLAAVICCVVIRDWGYGGCRLDYRDRARCCCRLDYRGGSRAARVDGATGARVLCDGDQFRKSVFAQQAN
jgi:hypothetical protein